MFFERENEGSDDRFESGMPKNEARDISAELSPEGVQEHWTCVEDSSCAIDVGLALRRVEASCDRGHEAR